MIENIIYNTKCDTRNTGDLYLPENADRNTPLALSIHGGGWSAMDKSSFAGVAEFLCGLGMAVFNIDYRLLTDAPWPICGDDCLRAAGFLLEARHPSLDYLNHGKILVVGASAGGHLALMTGLRLPPEKVNGIISISGVCDLEYDLNEHPGRYWNFWKSSPDRKDIDGASPMTYISKDQPPVFCCHWTDDKVVNADCSRRFVKESLGKGAKAELFEYAGNGDGHCIWIDGSNPHRLYNHIEQAIAKFLRENTKITTSQL
jgi:acetyl esterase/lipase